MKNFKALINLNFYLLIFLLPLQTSWIWHQGVLNNSIWQYGTFGLYVTDILAVLFIVSSAIYAVKKRKEIDFKKFLNARLFFLLLFLIWAFASIVWSVEKNISIYTVISILFFIILSLIIWQRKSSWQRIATVLISSGVIEGVFAMWQFFDQKIVANKWLGLASHSAATLGDSVVESGLDRWLRAYGTMSHPNILAAFLAINVLWCFALLDRIKTKKQWWFLLVGLTFNLIGLFLTFSREGWIGLIAGIIVYLIFRERINKSKDLDLKNRSIKFGRITILYSVVLLVVLVGNFWQPLSVRFDPTKRLESKSIEERIASYDRAKQIIANNLWLGVGPGAYTYKLFLLDEKAGIKNIPAWIYQPSHNVYLLIFSEVGLIGFVCLAVFIILTLINALKRVLSKDGDAYIYLPLFSVILVIALFDHFFWTTHFGQMFFWIILGLLL